MRHREKIVFAALLPVALCWVCACRRTPAVPLTSAEAVNAYVKTSGLPIDKIEILKEYPHDKNSYTQGLLYRDGVLYESTGLEGASTLRKVEIETGKTLAIQKLPADYFGEGLCIFDDELFQITWQNKIALVYDLKTLAPRRTYAYDGEGWGLTTDGKRLIMTDGTDTIFWRDPKTFAVLLRTKVTAAGQPLFLLNELEWIDGEIWANVYLTPWIARIDPTTGAVKSWVDLQPIVDRAGPMGNGECANGIAWDATARRVFLTGKHWQGLFQAKLIENR